jgi:hypothetical protein
MLKLTRILGATGPKRLFCESFLGYSCLLVNLRRQTKQRAPWHAEVQRPKGYHRPENVHGWRHSCGKSSEAPVLSMDGSPATSSKLVNNLTEELSTTAVTSPDFWGIIPAARLFPKGFIHDAQSESRGCEQKHLGSTLRQILPCSKCQCT